MVTDWLGNSLSFFDKGGVVIWILFILSLIALAIIIIKAWQFWRLHPGRLDFVADNLERLSQGDTQTALDTLAKIGHPVARVMETAILTGNNPAFSRHDRNAEIERVGSGEIRRVESQIGALEIIANLSPLLGLLGTVIGMIAAFSELEDAGANVDPTVLAGGIWTALLTTAYGLAIAIPALGAFYMFEGAVTTMRSAMKDAAISINGILKTDNHQ